MFIYMRSFIFYLVFYTSLIVVSLVVIALYPIINTKTIQKISSFWILSMMHVLKMVCGIRWVVEGRENIPDNGCILVSNHQGIWESLFLQTLKIPSTSIIKRELLLIPFFGWGLAALRPITLNRSRKLKSLKRVLKKGAEKLQNNFSVIIFPEGTRGNPDAGIQKFSSSFSKLSIESGAPVVPICHNSGRVWVNKSFLKLPGTIKIKIGKQIKGSTSKDLTYKTYSWFAETYNDM